MAHHTCFGGVTGLHSVTGPHGVTGRHRSQHIINDSCPAVPSPFQRMLLQICFSSEFYWSEFRILNFFYLLMLTPCTGL